MYLPIADAVRQWRAKPDAALAQRIAREYNGVAVDPARNQLAHSSLACSLDSGLTNYNPKPGPRDPTPSRLTSTLDNAVVPKGNSARLDDFVRPCGTSPY